jgi:2-polyprenyl-3-methyl-5-hydroxy-6-metoxy-1,4-benzoquinol methylase
MSDERAASDPDLLAEQIAYYRARAPEYDEWWLRTGRYDHGAAENRRWFAEMAQVEAALDHFDLGDDVLELAAGTGLWSQLLARRAKRLTCLDAAPEVLERNRERVDAAHVRYVLADLFAWQPDRRYDSVFFSFWLSHVPDERFDAFWRMVAAALRPGAGVFLVDSRYAPTSTAVDHTLGERGDPVRQRLLDDGRAFRVVKVFHEVEDLRARLADLGWQSELRQTATHFLYGTVRRAG